MIQLVGITKSYKNGSERHVVLDDISLAIHPGELVAIVGPSGSGKTTLTHIIGGLLRPDKGELIFEGEPLHLKSDKTASGYRNGLVGFVFQNYSLLPDYTALENVTLPMMVAGYKRRQRKKLALQYLKLLGLEQQAKQRANQLSGGQRQRVGIARALIMQPQLLIADEPTGNLDSARGAEIMTILQNLSHKKGIATVVVTHDDRLAARADRVVHILDGRIVSDERGTAEPASAASRSRVVSQPAPLSQRTAEGHA